jgi:chromosome segregation ATPase
VIEGQSDETWKQYSAAVLDILAYHTTECVSKSEHLELLEQKSLLEQSSAAINAAVQEQESTFKKASTDHASLLAKIAELEDQIYQLNLQVELLEAENIGKEAIIKALQDEYDYQEKKIRDLSKNEDAGKEVVRLEDELRRLTDHTRETDEWIKQVRGDNEKYREAYLKADVAREETLLEMAKLHEQLAESEHTRMQVENQLQVEVSALIKKHGLSPEELSRLSKMNVDSAQNLNLKQKVLYITTCQGCLFVLLCRKEKRLLTRIYPWSL